MHEMTPQADDHHVVATAHWSPLPGQLNHDARLLVHELRALKDGTGLSLAGLSARTHYSRSSWERWLNGKRLITAQALTAFAGAVEVDGARLISLLNRARAEPVSTASTERARDDWHPVTRSPSRRPARIAQVPADIQNFTGRLGQVRALMDAVAEKQLGIGQVAIAVIAGASGTGKTALATHVAHQVAERFPDGTLYAELRGSTPEPRDPADVLADWLLALGEPAEWIASSADGRSARLRSLLHDRQILLLLDDARDSRQVRPLLPGTEACAVVVTSRRRMADLLIAKHFELSPMPDPEARALLGSVIGAQRLAAEPVAAKTIIDACAGLPLALRIAGARLATRPAWNVGSLASRLADPRRLLDELTLGALSVRAGLQASYALLPPADSPASSRSALGLLAGAPSLDFRLPDAAALLSTSESAAERLLDPLVDVYLVEEPSAGWYRLHILTQQFAAELAGQAGRGFTLTAGAVSAPPAAQRAAR